MSKHEHKECGHDLRYCNKCDVVYCTDCDKEWGKRPDRPWLDYKYDGNKVTYDYNVAHYECAQGEGK